MRSRTLTLALLLVALAAGCGDDDSNGGGGSGGSAYGGQSAGGDDGGGAGSRLELSADPGGALRFDKKSLSTKAGKVTVVLDNPSDVPHAIEVEGDGVEEEGETVTKGGVSKVTVDLEKGSYEYYCPVDDHAAAGMKGTLTAR